MASLVAEQGRTVADFVVPAVIGSTTVVFAIQVVLAVISCLLFMLPALVASRAKATATAHFGTTKQ